MQTHLENHLLEQALDDIKLHIFHYFKCNGSPDKLANYLWEHLQYDYETELGSTADILLDLYLAN